MLVAAEVVLRAVEAVTIALAVGVASRAVVATAVLAVEITMRAVEAVTVTLAVEVA